MARVSIAQKAVLVELSVLGIYGSGFEDAYDFEDTMTIKTWFNHLVQKSLLKKGLVTKSINEYGETVVTLTRKGWELGNKEVKQFDRPLDASNFYRFTRGYNRIPS